MNIGRWGRARSSKIKAMKKAKKKSSGKLYEDELPEFAVSYLSAMETKEKDMKKKKKKKKKKNSVERLLSTKPNRYAQRMIKRAHKKGWYEVHQRQKFMGGHKGVWMVMVTNQPNAEVCEQFMRNPNVPDLLETRIVHVRVVSQR